MIERDIISVLYRENKKKSKYILPNVFYYGKWEADVLIVNQDLSTIEYEIKCDRKDWSAEFIDKKDKHELLAKGEICANKYCFICPEGMIKKEEVPKYAGLMYVTPAKKIRIIKRPPILNKGKIDPCTLIDKIYYRLEKLMTKDFNTTLRRRPEQKGGKKR